jgi:hypothetical protein
LTIAKHNQDSSTQKSFEDLDFVPQKRNQICLILAQKGKNLS